MLMDCILIATVIASYGSLFLLIMWLADNVSEWFKLLFIPYFIIIVIVTVMLYAEMVHRRMK